MQPIYTNGGYQVVPLVQLVAVTRRRDGARVSVYPIEAIEEAICTVDELATREGETAHRVYRG